ncbi:hypothetical protein Pfo_007717 [Paulownia fortunei]|nr:hypothetical protein Pfo_007717 [Paulownia fortunei]
MAVLPSKSLVMVSLFLVFFISTTTQARNLVLMESHQPPKLANGINGVEMLATEEELPDSEDLAVMDYTPVQKKTPVHN